MFKSELAIQELNDLLGIKIVKIIKLSGGRNNRIYRLHLSGGQKLIFKDYLFTSSDFLERLDREWIYLTRLMKLSCDVVAKPIISDRKKAFSIFQNREGQQLSSDFIKKKHIKQAAKFIVEQSKIDLQGLPIAKGAFFKLEHHLADIDNRIAEIAKVVASGKSNKKLKEFVERDLTNLWQLQKSYIIRNKNETLFFGIKPYASPSDFGFHNILSFNNDLSFIDFEYAGIDDLAKLVADFSVCTSSPRSFKKLKLFKDHLYKNIKLDKNFKKRLELILTINEFKWICIELNDFLPGKLERKRLVCDESLIARQKRQLDLAKERFGRIELKKVTHV